MKKKTIILGLLTSFLGLNAQENKEKDSIKEKKIDEVVITALGIKRQAKSLTYSAQQIGSDDLNTVKTPNLLNAIDGKVSNVQINKTNGGVGGSVRFVIRGDKSTRSSQPLIVIDGIPIVNNTGGPITDRFESMPDRGDIMSTINPEDIQSINFLKGASAAALYGAAGSNGAVLIVTKKGSEGRSTINYTTTLNFDQVYSLPKLQHEYLQTEPFNPANGDTGSDGSWGAKGNSKDYVKNFFKTGTTWINNLSFQAGNDKTTNFFSIGNTTNSGVIPTSTFDQYNINFRNTSKFFDNKLILDANVMGSIQDIKNRITPGLYFSPLTSLYWLPRGINFDNFSGENYYYFNKVRQLDAQNWWAIKPDGSFTVDTQNPYWLLNRNPVFTNNRNLYGSLGLSYAINSWLTARIRANYNYYTSTTERDVAAYSLRTVLLSPDSNGKMYLYSLTRRTSYADMLLTGSRNLTDDIGLDFTIGGSLSDIKVNDSRLENNMLVFANLFSLNNLIWSGKAESGRNYTIISPRRQDQSVFASTTFNYKKMVYLDLTYRNDWSSTLSNTPNYGYDYQSIGANAILSEIFKLPKSFSFWKIRASYAAVGNALDPASTSNIPNLDAGSLPGTVSGSPVVNPLFPELFPKPEYNGTFETGTEIRLFNNRLNFDFTYYNSKVSNQMLRNISVASDLSPNSGKADINSGEIQNTGFESTLSYQFLKKDKLAWTATLNASANKNKISKLFPSNLGSVLPNQVFFLAGGSYSAIKEGGAFGDIYGAAFQRDNQGRIVVNDKGAPIRAEGKHLLGNPNPKFLLGLGNSINIGKFHLYFLIDGKFGGKVLARTEADNDRFGVSQTTADARNAGGVSIPNAVFQNGNPYNGKTDPKEYFTAIADIDEAYIYDATNIRLRQVSASYTFKMKKLFKEATVSIIGSNLFFFYKKVAFDPDQVSGVYPGGVGVDLFGMPITRTIGLSLKTTF